jgi:4-hydroxy-3-polyprenylbenzoate decarboxylase
MRLVIAATGASGAIYLQRLLDQVDARENEVHLILSAYARQVIQEEMGGELLVPERVKQHGDRTMNVPFVSGSTRFDAMVVVPCSMGTLARIAAGTADSTILRAADVFLKERRKLILVPRETPWNLIHMRNACTLLEAGAVILPASPHFYGRPKSIEELVDTVVARILDQIDLPSPTAVRWSETSGSEE